MQPQDKDRRKQMFGTFRNGVPIFATLPLAGRWREAGGDSCNDHAVVQNTHPSELRDVSCNRLASDRESVFQKCDAILLDESN